MCEALLIVLSVGTVLGWGCALHAIRGWRRAIRTSQGMLEAWQNSNAETFRAWRRSQSAVFAATQAIVDEVLEGPDEDDPRVSGA
jgi:hypothetical protein